MYMLLFESNATPKGELSFSGARGFLLSSDSPMTTDALVDCFVSATVLNKGGAAMQLQATMSMARAVKCLQQKLLGVDNAFIALAVPWIERHAD
jgi:hypothetical protein